MKKPDEIAKITDFIPVGDDSFIDDNGITNRWAQRRRQRQMVIEEERLQHLREAELMRVERGIAREEID